MIKATKSLFTTTGYKNVTGPVLVGSSSENVNSRTLTHDHHNNNDDDNDNNNRKINFNVIIAYQIIASMNSFTIP